MKPLETNGIQHGISSKDPGMESPIQIFRVVFRHPLCQVLRSRLQRPPLEAAHLTLASASVELGSERSEFPHTCWCAWCVCRGRTQRARAGPCARASHVALPPGIVPWLPPVTRKSSSLGFPCGCPVSRGLCPHTCWCT